MSVVMDRPMSKAKGVTIRIDEKALAEAKIAAAYLGMGVQEYISDRILKIALKEIEDAHGRRAGDRPKR